MGYWERSYYQAACELALTVFEAKIENNGDGAINSAALGIKLVRKWRDKAKVERENKNGS